jgi:hypothetical protein
MLSWLSLRLSVPTCASGSNHEPDTDQPRRRPRPGCSTSGGHGLQFVGDPAVSTCGPFFDQRRHGASLVAGEGPELCSGGGLDKQVESYFGAVLAEVAFA